MNDPRLFDASPNPYLLLDRGLRIVAANRAFLDSVRRPLAALAGKRPWDAFPDEAGSLRQVVASVERVIRTRRPDTMALLRFDLPRPDAEGGGLEERHWSITHAPLLDAEGEVEFILQHPIDVTELHQLQAAIERTGLDSALGLSPAQSGIVRRAQSVYDTNLALQAQSARLTEMFAQAPGFMALFRGPEHRFELANRSYEALTGHRPLLGRTLAEALPDAAAQGYVALLDRVFRSGEAYSVAATPYAMQAEPGGPAVQRFLDLVCQPIRDAAGQVTGIFVQGTDVTERKAGEAALAESEARYRTLFETVETGFCIIELRFDAAGRAVDYRIVEANPAFERLTGQYGATGRWVSDFAPGLERHWFDTYGAVALTGEPARFENAARAFGRWYDVQALRIGAPDARRVAILFNDISERRRAEEALLALTASLEAQVAERTRDRDRIWRLSTDIMMVARFDGTIIATNPAWEAVLGWTEAELPGRNCIDFMHPDDRDEAARAIDQLRHGETLWRSENRFRHRDGSFRWIAWTAVPGDGLINAVGRDVQQDKEQAEALRRSEDALRQSQKMEAVGQLTGGLAHDFNNLLTGITGSLEMVQARIAQGRVGELDRFVQAALGGARRAAALTHRLLAFSRRQTLDPRPTDVNRLVAGMEELLRRTVGPGTEVTLVAADGLWPTLVDAGQLENALLNLCINARDAMPDGGCITIETANRRLDERAARDRDLPPGRYVSLRVSDTGCGMTPDTIAKAFDPFFTTKPIGQGTGLGLSMIYGFARQSGGQVRIRSAPGAGTTVGLYLPRHAGAAEDAEPPAAPAGPLPAGQGETVLVVDDETVVRMLVAEVLEELGYTALEAADGPQALQLLRSPARIDLLVTDVGLPGGMNGRQVADAARALRPDLTVLFITGYAENAVLRQGQLDPGMHVLTKPFAMDALAARIKGLLGGG